MPVAAPTPSAPRAFLFHFTLLFLLAAAFFAGRDAGSFERWIGAVIVSSVLCGLLVAAVAWTWRKEKPDRRWVVFILGAAVLLRLLVMPASRELSDDGARYHWDGKVLVHGVNPYRYAPDDPALDPLPDHPIDGRINHPGLPTCYPPLAEILFAAAYALRPGSLAGFHGIALLFEIGSWVVLLGILRRRGGPVSFLLIAAWSPLLVFQGYLPGHVDLLTLLPVSLFLDAVLRGRPGRAGLFLALACLIKPLPLLFLPAAILRFRGKGGHRLLGVFGAVVLLFYLPFLPAGRNLFASTWAMAVDWSFNGSLAPLLGAVLPEPWTRPLLGIATFALVVAAAKRGADVPSKMLLAGTAFLLFTPTLFPWYLIVLYPLLTLRPDPALLLLGALLPLADEVIVLYRGTGAWEPAPWAAFAIHLPFYGILLLAAIRRWGMFGARSGDNSILDRESSPR